MNPSMSVCIPVYNCASFLGQALDSILVQAGDAVEVIVYDGGSSDGTSALMAGYCSQWPKLRYQRGEHRGGIDADLATCVGLSRGAYCWLFSGDDVMRPGAIAKAFEFMESQEDVYICKHTVCDGNMRVLGEHPVLSPDKTSRANLANRDERRDWFRRAETTEAFFSFMSSLIIRADKWNAGQFPKEFDASCWGHVARLFSLSTAGLHVCYVAEIWLDRRGGTDSFSDGGIVNRYRIGIEGYHRLADRYFGPDSIEAFHVRRVIRKEFSLKMFLYAKSLCREHRAVEKRELLDGLVRVAYCDSSLVNRFKSLVYFLFPVWIYQQLRRLYRVVNAE